MSIFFVLITMIIQLKMAACLITLSFARHQISEICTETFRATPTKVICVSLRHVPGGGVGPDLLPQLLLNKQQHMVSISTDIFLHSADMVPVVLPSINHRKTTLYLYTKTAKLTSP